MYLIYCIYLVEEDQLYKSVKCLDYLKVDQLPRQVKIFEHTVNGEMWKKILMIV